MKPGDFARSRGGSDSGSGSGSGTCRVLVALTMFPPDDAVLKRLEAAGLTIESVVGSTVIGAAAVEAIPAIESDESVAAVERSEPLGLHEHEQD